MSIQNIRNFLIMAHVDHGKSTLADRMLEITGTIEKRKMQEQVLDSMELERERGITIKMQPVKMVYHPNRRINTDKTQNDAEFLYGDLTYKIRGILFDVRKKLGLGHKEQIYHNALEIEFEKAGMKFESKKNISIMYEGKSIGTYQPDFVIDDKVLIELKALPEIAKPQIEQLWSYLKGCDYKLALLVNFGSKELDIKRVIYDSARPVSVPSASGQRVSAEGSNQIESETYILNLIDTPGHIDFSYEVSRAMRAVEGSILLVDATQGVQAQTLTTLNMAHDLGLTIIPVVSKIDSPLARIEEVKDEIANLLKVPIGTILEVSGKTGEGVENLLKEVIKRVPAPVSRESALSPHESAGGLRALVFDFQYSNHRGVTVYVRVMDGEIRKGDTVQFMIANEKFTALEVGIFSPQEVPTGVLHAGEIGYIVTGIKEPGIASVGDTVAKDKSKLEPLQGYMKPSPMVWASIYPESQDDLTFLRQALGKLSLSDSAFTYEEESSGTLGRGFRSGFLGMLHLEIITERLRREFDLELVVTTPSITYEVTQKNGKTEIIYSPSLFPDDGMILSVNEPWVKMKIITPHGYIGKLSQLLFEHEGTISGTETFGENRTTLIADMPLRELMRNFFDEIKSVTSGYASISYELTGMRLADVCKLEILVGDEVVHAFTRVVARKRAYEDAEQAVEKLYNILPKQMFTTKIQGKATGRILSSRTLSALKKDVTAKLSGGDITRKKKLWERQKEGKKRLKERGHGSVNIPQEVFVKMIRAD